MNTLQETLFLNSSDYYNALVTDINQAQTSVDIEMYCFQRDQLGQKIANALIAASSKGIHIRILVDGVGSPFWRGKFVEKMEKNGIETKIFHPLPWNLLQYHRASTQKPWIKRLLYLITKINARNHKKLIMIDQRIAYIGSRNIDQCHLELAEGGQNWHDASIRLVHIGFPELNIEFERLWGSAGWEERFQHYFKSISFTTPIRLNNTHSKRRLYYKQLLRKIAKAKQRIYITNAYFLPNVFLLKKIKDAARDGVDVRLLIPQKSDITMMPWAANALYDSLLKAGVKIYEYHCSMMHAKSIIIDEWFLVGSSNLNHRSLLHDLEIDALVQSNENKEIMLKQFFENLHQSHQIHSHNQQRSIIKRLIGHLILRLKWLL